MDFVYELVIAQEFALLCTSISKGDITSFYERLHYFPADLSDLREKV